MDGCLTIMSISPTLRAIVLIFWRSKELAVFTATLLHGILYKW